MRTLTLTPAYGRDYKSVKAVAADWEANKDFLIADISSPWDGKPVNRDSLVRSGEATHVNVRYHNMRRVARIEVR